MPQLQINDVTLHYEAQGAGTALLLLHAFPVHSGMWRAQTAELAKIARVTTLDFRGFGQSSKTGPFKIDQLADDVHALASHLQLGKFVLAGISMGGYVALSYARRYASTLAGLVLLDTRADGESAEGKVNRDRMIEIARTRGAKPIADAMLGKLLSPHAAEHRPDLVRELRDMMESTDPATLAHALAAMRDRADHTYFLPDIKIPTQIIVGDQDAVTPPEIAEKMRHAIPDSSLAVINDSGHMSPLEKPEKVSGVLHDFLTRLA